MLATSYLGPKRLRVESKPMPTIRHPGDAILKVTRTAICGSDLHLYHGYMPDTRVGSTFGHEFAGVIEEVGPAVSSLKRGDRVVVPFNIFCGGCFFCDRGLYSACEKTNPNSSLMGGAFGYSHTTGGYEGGQAEYVRIPFADVGPMRIPDDMTEEDVLFLSDIFPTGYQAAEMGDIQPGAVVAVFGAGPVGQFTAKSARLLGAGRVIVLDRLEDRLDLARRFAEAETIDFTEVGDPVAYLKKVTDGRGPDVCIDAVGLEASGSAAQTFFGRKLLMQAGAATALNWSISAVRRGGTVVMIGAYGPPWNLVPIGLAMNKGLTIRGAQCNVKRYMGRLLEWIREGKVDPKAVISHRIPLADAAEAYKLFAAKRDGCTKVVLIPPEAA